MDTLKSEKIHAITMYKRNQILKSVFLYSFTALASLLYSSPFWFPSISYSMETLFNVCVSKLSSVVFSSKCVFIVGNMIIVALIIGESKIFSSNPSSTKHSHESANSYYEEYINSRKNLHKYSVPINKKLCTVETKTTRVCEYKAEKDRNNNTNNTNNNKDLGKVEKRLVVKGSNVNTVNKNKNNNNNNCNEVVLATEELKKRSDDFIARVNKRRVFEARGSLCD